MTERDDSGDAMRDFDRKADGETWDALARAKLPHTDVGNAQRLRMAYGDSLRYVPGVGWVVWNGRIWDAEFGETAALTIAANLPDLLIEESAALSSAPVPKAQLDAWLAENEGESEEAGRKSIRAARKRGAAGFAKSCGSIGKLNAALSLLRDHCRARVIDLDPCPFRLTAANGELDLDALAADRPEAEEEEERVERMGRCLGPFRKESLSTRMLGCDFDPAADAPRWRRFIETALPDPEMRAFAQRLAGYLLSGRNNVQVALVLLGPGGNGKSTFANGLARVMGSYAAACRIEMFLESRNVSQGPTPEEAVLPGARVLIASEPEPDATLSSSKIKSMTGGERRLSHAKGKAPFEWFPHGVPLLSFNKVPRISDESEGMWRRLTFLPFNVYLPDLPADRRVDHAEMERILEAEASGILNWMVDGWIAFRAVGLAPPAEAVEIKARQRALADPIGEFMVDCTVGEAAASIQSSELHKVYEAWCEANGARPYSLVKFAKTLLDKGYLRVKSGGRSMWRGVGWNPADEIWQLRLKADPKAEP